MTDPEPSHADRVALVSGAAGGIGQAVAVGLAQRGATVVATDVQSLEETALLLGRGHLCAPLDVTQPSQIEALAQRIAEAHGRLDILINNAALHEASRWDDLEPELWRRIMAVNLDGPMLMCRAFVPLMRRYRWGRIVNVSSGSVMQPILGSIAYRTSKMGLIGLTRALASELGDEGITVNAVCPSVTDTPMAAAGIPDAVIAGLVARQSIKRFAQPEDIAGGVMFLTGPESGWVTGQTMMVNGGASFL